MFKMMNRNVNFIIRIVTYICIIAFIIGVIIFSINYFKRHGNNNYNPTNINESDFNLSVLKRTSLNSESNFLVSPYSISLALNMLKDGADGKTKKEIEDALGNANTKIIDNESVHIANAMFVKEDYKNEVKNEYKDLLVNNHKADILYDKFNTPTVINTWVNEKTDGMIPTLLDEMSKDFVLGLANAIAIDVKWESPFECNYTSKDTFNSPKAMDVAMMHQSYSYNSAKFIHSANANGVILNYEEESGLEYVALLPTVDLTEYIKNLTTDELKTLDDSKIEASNKLHINVSLPKYSYSFDYNKFMDMLNDMGIKQAFDEEKANFTNMMSKDDMNKIGGNLYVNTAIHKTYIDLNEKGTKAAAVTYFGVDKATAIRDDYDTIDIKFDRPFLYMIRDKEGNILFTGVVKEPNKWDGTTCKRGA